MTTAAQKLIAAVQEYLAERHIPDNLVVFVKVGPNRSIHIELLEDGAWIDGD